MRNNLRFLLAGRTNAFQACLRHDLESVGGVFCLTQDNFDLTNEGACVAYASLFKPDCLVCLNLEECGLDREAQPSGLIPALTGLDSLFVEITTQPATFAEQCECHAEEEEITCFTGQAALLDGQIREILKQEFVPSLVIRLGTLHSAHSDNFITSFLKSAVGKRHVTLRREGLISLISDRLASKMILRLVSKAQSDKKLCGLYYLACSGQASKADVLAYALEAAKKARPDLKWPKVEIRAEQSPLPDHSLDCLKFQDVCGLILPDWQDGVIETATGYALQIK